MTLLIIYLCIAIGVSFLCSILEAVLLSVTPGFVETELKEHPRRAQVLKRVKDDLDESISSILILNTFAHTMGAAGVGAQAVRVFGPQWESLIAFLLTLAILYLSEIIPKTLGATFWKQLALPCAYIIRVLIKLLLPFVWVSAKLTGLFSGGGHASKISREELASMARVGARQGALGQQEGELMENILDLRHITTGEILTPRSVVTAVDADLPLATAMEQLKHTHFTRIPIYDGSIDNVVGVVFRPALQERALANGDLALKEIATPAFFVSEKLPVLPLMDTFIKRREHLFIVEDEFGQMEGVVTLEDALETLLGREIMDESDQVEDMQQLAKRRFRDRRRPRR